MKLRNKILLLMSACMLGLTSCERRELEIYYPEKVRLRIDVDWLTKYKALPTGMTLLFSKDGDAVTQTVLSNDVKSTYVDLEPGVYKMLIFNQSVSEFSTFNFNEIDSHDRSYVRANQLTSNARKTWRNDMTYVYDPEKLGAATDTIAVTEEMLEKQVIFENYKNGKTNGEVADSAIYVYKEVAHRLTQRLYVKARVRGIKNMGSVQAYVTGLAAGCQLSQVWRLEDTGTLLLNTGWVQTTDSTRAGEGWITTSIPTFGFKSGKEYVAKRDSTDNEICFNFVLRDGSTAVFSFNVGKLIHYIGHEPGAILLRDDVTQDLKLILDLPNIADGDVIELPDVEYDQKAGGFDAIVEPWEDGGTFDINL